MNLNFDFFFYNILMGVGLAMDAFSVSVANGLGEPFMKKRKMVAVSGVFAFFQFLMPMIGWVLVTTVLELFEAAEGFIPVIALLLLSYIGGKMLYDGIKCKNCGEPAPKVSFAGLIVQGVATSIDALSVGLTIADYDALHALIATLLIGAVTFVICFAGIIIGKKLGNIFAGRATIFGGAILIFIGIEIFVSSII